MFRTDCIFYLSPCSSDSVCYPYCFLSKSCDPSSVSPSCCPCNNFITRSIVKDLQDCGDIYTDYSRLLDRSSDTK